MNDLTKTLQQSFKDKEYRHGYVDDFSNVSIATQIKVLREQHNWTQEELAKEAGMLQPRISAMENVNYSAWSIKILRRLAEAFDLTLRVSFENFSTRVGDIEKFSRKDLERVSFEKDQFFQKKIEETLNIDLEEENQKLHSLVFGKVFNIDEIQEQQKTAILDAYKSKQKSLQDQDMTKTPALQLSMGG